MSHELFTLGYQVGSRDAMDRLLELGHLSKEEILQYALDKSEEITKEIRDGGN